MLSPVSGVGVAMARPRTQEMMAMEKRILMVVIWVVCRCGGVDDVVCLDAVKEELNDQR